MLLAVLVMITLQPLTGFAKPQNLPSRLNPIQNSDLIIVGAGLAGLSAALEAGRSGAKVLVIDEASIFGGHAIMSEGELNIIDSPFQRSKGIETPPISSARAARQDRSLCPKGDKTVGEGQLYREIRHHLGLSKNTVLDIVKRDRAA
jgi:FAD binding domain